MDIEPKLKYPHKLVSLNTLYVANHAFKKLELGNNTFIAVMGNGCN